MTERRFSDEFASWLGSKSPDPAPFFEGALIVVDANVILDLYRVSAATRGQILDVLSLIRDRLWIPHQVAIEYVRNRRDAVIDRNKTFSQMKKMLAVSEAQTIESLNQVREKFMEFRDKRRTMRQWDPQSHGLSKEDLETKLKGLWKGACDELSLLEREISLTVKDLDSDVIVDRLDEILSGRIGSPYSSVELEEHVNHAIKFRFPNQIPPGYADVKEKPTEIRQAGDYLVWRQLIDQMRELSNGSPKRVIFVTGDFKNDWWVLGDDSVILNPRPELADEMRHEADAELMVLSVSDLLLGAKQYLQHEVTDSAIEEVEEQEKELAGSAVLAEAMRRAQGDLVNPGFTEMTGDVQNAEGNPEVARGDQEAAALSVDFSTVESAADEVESDVGDISRSDPGGNS